MNKIERSQGLRADIPNPYAVFADKPKLIGLLNEAERLLQQSMDGEIPFSQVRDFLHADRERSILTIRQSLLGDRSPMEALRARIIVNRSPSESIMTNHIKEKRIPSAQKPFFGSLTLVAERGDIGSEGNITTQVVHLMHQRVINLRTIQYILDTYPNLRIIEIMPSQDRLIGAGIRKLAASKGIEIKFGRIKDADHYDETLITQQYLNKKRAFDAMLKDPLRSRIFRNMQEYEFEEIEMSFMYFGKERIPIRRISKRLGVREMYVQRKLAAICHWLGIPSKDQEIQIMADHLLVRLNRLERTRESRETYEAYRKRFRVGESLPPLSLKPGRWEMWQKLQTLYESNPQTFDNLRGRHPRWFDSLVHYFQLGEAEGIFTPMKEIGQKYGISYERIRQLKNKALGPLGLLETE